MGKNGDREMEKDGIWKKRKKDMRRTSERGEKGKYVDLGTVNQRYMGTVNQSYMGTVNQRYMGTVNQSFLCLEHEKARDMKKVNKALNS